MSSIVKPGNRAYTELEICCRIIKAAMRFRGNEFGGPSTEEIKTYLQFYGNYTLEEVYSYCRKLCENQLFGEVQVEGKTVAWKLVIYLPKQKGED